MPENEIINQLIRHLDEKLQEIQKALDKYGNRTDDNNERIVRLEERMEAMYSRCNRQGGENKEDFDRIYQRLASNKDMISTIKSTQATFHEQVLQTLKVLKAIGSVIALAGVVVTIIAFFK